MARYGVQRGGYTFRGRWRYNEIVIDGDRAIVLLGHKDGEPDRATIDAENVAMVRESAYWSVIATATPGLYYAQGTARGEDQPIGQRKPRVYLHRLIMGCVVGDGTEVDHEDGNGLHCTVANMRKTDSKGNQNNRRQQRRERQLEDALRRILACQCGKDGCACRAYARSLLPRPAC